MTFYKVVTPDKTFRINGYVQTIEDELYTQKEYEKFSKPDKYGKYLKQEWLEKIEHPKNKTYWMFGARFAF